MAVLEPTMAPIKPVTVPIKPTTASFKPMTAPFELMSHSHSTSSKCVLPDISLVASSGNASMLHLPQQACSKGGADFKHSPRLTQLKTPKSIYANALAHTDSLTYANVLVKTGSLRGVPLEGTQYLPHARLLALGFSLLNFPLLFLNISQHLGCCCKGV
jgi:hypothetical protein